MAQYYQSSRPKNPYYRPRVKEASPWGRVVFLSVIALATAFVVFMFSSALAITEIRVEGAGLLREQDIRAVVSESLSTYSRLPFVRSERIKRHLQEQFELAAVEVEKDYPHTLWVGIVERKPRVAWQTASGAWILDQDGGVLEKIDVQEPRRAGLTYFFDESGTDPENNQFISSARLTTALSVGERLTGEYGLEILVVKFSSPSDPFAKYVTGEGWELFIDLAGDIDLQFSKLETVLLELGDQRLNLRYIDVRLADRVYYQ